MNAPLGPKSRWKYACTSWLGRPSHSQTASRCRQLKLHSDELPSLDSTHQIDPVIHSHRSEGQKAEARFDR
jgi:hypothetical protein